MSIILPGQLSHSNPDFAIADIKDVRGGIRSIDILDNASLDNLMDSSYLPNLNNAFEVKSYHFSFLEG